MRASVLDPLLGREPSRAFGQVFHALVDATNRRTTSSDSVVICGSFNGAAHGACLRSFTDNRIRHLAYLVWRSREEIKPESTRFKRSLICLGHSGLVGCEGWVASALDGSHTGRGWFWQPPRIRALKCSLNHNPTEYNHGYHIASRAHEIWHA